MTKDQELILKLHLEDADNEYCDRCQRELKPKAMVPLWHKQLDWHFFGSECAKIILKENPFMYFKKEPDGSMTLKIDRPEDMSVERFLVIAARLEKIIDKLGGKVRVIG